jgi:Fe2+ or Zn2+ uptake regulation protein
MSIDTIFKKIRACGGRISKIRKEIIRTLLENDCLTSQADILARLRDLRMEPNRSTIFRELLFLTKHNIVLKSTILGTDYYEIPQEHHHHLVCVNCNSITKVKIGNHLERQEKEIAKQNQFNITSHSLEFYGYCHNCRVTNEEVL